MQKIFVLFSLSLFLTFSCKEDKIGKKGQSLKEMQDHESKNAENYQPTLASASATPVYKTIDTTQMHLNIYYPENHKPGSNTPCIIYFFGGGFIQGSPAQHEEHCKYFASRGIVAITADYRVISRNNGNALNCIYDGKSAVRYLREHSEELGIDPNRIAVGGGSAGGLLAIECAINDVKWQDASDNSATSCVPNALVLINSVINAEEFQFRIRKFKDSDDAPDETSHASEINPLKHMPASPPPAIIFHGTADEIAQYKFTVQFKDQYTNTGGDIELHTYEGQPHGFAAIKYKEGKYYRETLKLTDEFLTRLGYLNEEPTVSMK